MFVPGLRTENGKREKLSVISVSPVAVVGMACRLPGGIDSPEQLWEALLAGADLVNEIPADRWDPADFYDPEPGVPGRSVSKWGGFLDDVAGFDPDFFGISEREAASIDPQHRMLLQTAWEAVEHAGIPPTSLDGSSTGVFVGVCNTDYMLISGEVGALGGAYGFTGCAHSMASGRIAYALGLQGPAATIDTACSSGLTAVHLACRSLTAGESDLALAGGCSLLLEPRGSASASAQGMLSSTGRSRTFDVAADGFVRSEGCAVVLLKRLRDAQRDGDRILAVIRGTATNQDGRSATITTPSLEAQVAVYRTALAAAGLDAHSVGMVEAHGTGTPVGDPIEYRSLARVYGTHGNQCLIGSVKSNLGHTEAAAGAVALIKAVLSLQYGVVPPVVHFTRLPDELAEIETGLVVPQTVTPWPSNGKSNGHRAPRRAAVSSYGMSGTNVHAIIEEAPASSAGNGRVSASRASGPLIFPLSSTSAAELRRTSARLAEWLDGHADDVALSDLAYTLARRRAHRPVRAAVIAGSHEELIEGLRELAIGDNPHEPAVGQDDRGPVWIFSGQGSQWASMGTELLAREPAFAATVALAEPLIERESGFSVTQAMTAPETVTGIDRVQPTLFVIQVALAETLKAHGVSPGAVIGHSLGEVAAAVVAGALSLEGGVRVICRRSRLCTRIAGAGAMASVELPAAQVVSELAARGVDDVVVSVVASPESTVVGGATQSVRELVEHWNQRDVMARAVAVDVASHSPQVDSILDELAEVLADLRPQQPTIPYYSATSFDPREKPTCDADYWVDNLRYAVRFSAAVQAALEDGYRVFAELSPHPLLTRAVDQTATAVDMPVAAMASMRREQPLPHGMRSLVVDLHSAGARMDFSVLCPGGKLVDAPLPTWAHRQLFHDRRGPNQGHGSHLVAVHPLLGSHVRLLEEPERHVWQADVGTDVLPWLADHRVHSVAALPGAGFCEMALAAARVTIGEVSEVRDIHFEQMLLLDGRTEVGTVVSVDAPGVADFVVETAQDGERVPLATAALYLAGDEQHPPDYDMPALLTGHTNRVDGAEVRESWDSRGVQFGPAFGGLVCVHVADGPDITALGEVALPASIRSQRTAYCIHPALLDACFLAAQAHPRVEYVGNGGLLLPLGARLLRVYGPARDARYCYSRVTANDVSRMEADVDVLDEHGTVLASVRGLVLGTGVPESADLGRVLAERLMTVEWEQRVLPGDPHADAGTWLLVSASVAADAAAVELADGLRLEHAETRTVSWPRDADHAACAQRLRVELSGARGVVVVAGPAAGDEDEHGVIEGREHVRHLVRIARELADLPAESPRLYVLTSHAQIVEPADEVTVNLNQAALRGLLRVIGAEHPQLRPTQIDLDQDTDRNLVVAELLSGSREDETAWRQGRRYAARLRPSPLRHDERRTAAVDHQCDGMRLRVRAPGDLQTTEFAAFERIPPGPGQIEVAVGASSVNFADVLNAMGKFPSVDGRAPELGMDFAGVVTAVGSDVTHHQIGDRVGGFSTAGCWATFVTCDANLAVTLPASVSEEQAAAASTAYATAWHGLRELARVKPGDRILIHSATGGVGQAAIAIAQTAGAEIFATAGTPQKRALLRDMGVEHVYDSRSVEFADLIRRDTGGYGVDIVLNSLTGAAQRAGLGLLATGGRFVEIGKRDVYANSRLELFPFRRNLSFYYADLALMCESHPDQIGQLLHMVYSRIDSGELPPLPHITYPLSEATTAIRVMSAAEHTGKLVLAMPSDGQTTVVVQPDDAAVFRSDGAYLITGGLGGLGLFLAEWMAAGGCGRIVLTSRSQPTPEAQNVIDLIRATGADLVVECGDIAEVGTADRLVALATATGLPLRGVLHAAAVVEDAVLTNITDDLIDRDWAPKTYGAWHLHHATLSQPLDWFCCFSSAAALLGSPGQGAYAAANSWLDAFTYWRRGQGLPASAIAWGAWAEIGRGAFLAESRQTTMITPEEGAYAFQTVLSYDRAYTGYVPTINAPWLASLVQRSPFAEAFKSAGQGRADRSKFREELSALHADEWPAQFRRLVSEQVSLILRRAIDPDRPLSDYGLDSLGSLELRTRIETETGIRISSIDITTVRALSERLCDTLAAKDGASARS